MKTPTRNSLFALLFAGVISLTLLVQQAQAQAEPIEGSNVPITGTIGFSGLATFNTNSLATATQVINFQPFSGGPNNSATVTNATGSFATTVTPGSLASFPNIYTFSPSVAVTPLWTVGGFTFNLTSSVIVRRESSFLDITGMGTITGPSGFSSTPGTWAFSSQSSGGAPAANFAFSANSHAIPEPSTYALLVGGTAFAAFVARRRKKS
ncbi:hypothetical protein BH20VER1_BH20VER1_07960 [soil metagenome]